MSNSTPTSPTSPTSFFKSSFFSSVTSSVNSLSQTIQTKGIPEINKRLNEIQQKARELPNQLATLQDDLESERTLFVQNKKLDEKNGHIRQAKGSELVAPWVGYQGYENEMKQAIMDISKDERNVLISPPEDTNFQFDLNAYSQSAQAALEEDKELSRLRFLLVPQQVTEPTFWRNYFYRVTIVKQTVLSQPPTEQEMEHRQNDDVLFDFKDDEEDENVAKKDDISSKEDDDTTTKEEESMIIIEKKPEASTATKKEENYEGMEDWEIELRKAAI